MVTKKHTMQSLFYAIKVYRLKSYYVCTYIAINNSRQDRSKWVAVQWSEQYIDSV